MPVAPLAALVLGVTAGLMVAAWMAARAGATARALACLVGAAVAIRLYAASEPSLHEWDERYHAVVARHLLAHPLTPTLYDPPALPYDYTDWHANHVWLHKPPLALWLMAASLRLFGISELALRLPSVALSSLGVALTFLVGRRLFDERTALLGAAFHAVNGLLVALASGRAPTDHVDTALITLVELGVLLSLVTTDQPRLATDVALGGSLGAALLTKWYPALVVLPLWVFLFFERRRKGMARASLPVLASAAAVAMPWALYVAWAFPREALWEWRDAWSHLTQAMSPTHAEPWLYLADMPRFFGEHVYAPLAWAVVAAFRRRSKALPFLLLWIAIPYTVFSISVTKMPAYVMISAPAVFLVEAWAFWELRDLTRLASGRLWCGLVLLLLAVLPARYLLRPGGPFTIDMRRPEWVSRLVALRGQIQGRRNLVFNVPHPIETMFYLPCSAYEGRPTAEQVAALRQEGYSVLVYDPDTGKLTPE